MHEYVFKMKKGDIEIELKSDDLEFVEEQLKQMERKNSFKISKCFSDNAVKVKDVSLFI